MTAARRPASVLYHFVGSTIVIKDRSTGEQLLTYAFGGKWARLSPAKKLTIAKTMLEIIEERETALGPTGAFGIGR